MCPATADTDAGAPRALDAVGETAQPGSGFGVGSTHTVVDDLDDDRSPVARHVDARGVRMGVLPDVRDALADHVVRRDLDGFGQPAAEVDVEVDRNRGVGGQLFDPDAIVEEAGFSPTDSEARVRADKVIALAQAEVVKLRALTPPSADVKKVAKVYDAIDAGWAMVADDPGLLTEEPSPLAKATKLASAYGFEVCGRG